MSKQENPSCRKKQYQKIGYDLKLSIIAEITNGQISVNHAAHKYQISRASISYWMKKLSSFEQTKKAVSLKDEIKKLKEEIERLEFIKDFQQDIIAGLEVETGLELAKKSLPEPLMKEIEAKKKDLSKRNGSANVSGSQNKPSTNEPKQKKTGRNKPR
ncbi:transposase [Flavobacterium caeni]|uniref:Transposase n=1 Tax=Flavobacterium caeni TaxID=490189 RepID=A0A1G5KNH8_9FLAO|nr:transposase [Flavobacterium caeni]SCZ02122.1 Transposase [Flavobacterium caeni]